MGDRLALQDFKRKIQILEVLQHFGIELKHAGSVYTALCPFHEEKTGSFVATPSRNTFHCFGCNSGGDAINFVMSHQNLEFPAAVNMLADLFHLQSPLGEKSAKLFAERKSLTDILELAANVFAHNLETTGGTEARAYLQKRGFTPDTLHAWKIGYSLDSWDGLLSVLSRKGIPEAEIEKASLAIRTDTGRLYDYFRGRIMFPAQDSQGRFVGFAGRCLDGREPKYLNCRETPVYRKGDLLYGFYQAKQSKQKTVIIVEGYTDVLMAHQFGITNVVALAGTALTPENAVALQRHYDRVILMLDPDRAGEKGTLRAGELLMKTGMKVDVAMLPELDLDELLIRDRVKAFDCLIDNAKPLHVYALDNALKGRDLLALGPDEKRGVLKELELFFHSAKDIVQCRLYLEDIARRLAVDYKIALAAISQSKPRQPSVFLEDAEAEFNALVLLLRKPDYTKLMQERLSQEHFFNPTTGALFSYLSANPVKGLEFSTLGPSLFDGQLINPQAVTEYAASTGKPVGLNDVCSLLSRIQSANAEQLFPDPVVFSLNQAKAIRELKQLEDQVHDASNKKDSTGVIDALQAYCAAYEKLTSQHKGQQG